MTDVNLTGAAGAKGTNGSVAGAAGTNGSAGGYIKAANTGNGMQFSLADHGFAGRNGYAAPDQFTAPTAPPATEDPVPVAALQGYGAWSGRVGGLDITV